MVWVRAWFPSSKKQCLGSKKLLGSPVDVLVLYFFFKTSSWHHGKSPRSVTLVLGTMPSVSHLQDGKEKDDVHFFTGRQKKKKTLPYFFIWHLFYNHICIYSHFRTNVHHMHACMHGCRYVRPAIKMYLLNLYQKSVIHKNKKWSIK